MTTALVAALLAVGLAVPATAGESYEITEHAVFTDIDPCTGLEHEVTQDVTFTVRENGDRAVARGVRTYSTSSGYSGRGVSSYVLNDQVERFRFTDQLADDAGHRIRVRGWFMLDRSSGTVRMDGFELTCVGA